MAFRGSFYQFFPIILVGRLTTYYQVLGRFKRFYDPDHVPVSVPESVTVLVRVLEVSISEILLPGSIPGSRQASWYQYQAFMVRKIK